LAFNRIKKYQIRDDKTGRKPDDFRTISGRDIRHVPSPHEFRKDQHLRNKYLSDFVRKSSDFRPDSGIPGVQNKPMTLMEIDHAH
jgi:hypothetical protein